MSEGEKWDLNRMETDKLQLKKGDYFVLLFVVVLLMVLMFCIKGEQHGDRIHVTANGTTTTYSMEKEQRIRVYRNSNSSPKQDSIVTNVIVISNGQVYMEQADCPDRVCVKHKPVSKNGEMIICLPNEVFVEVENSMENEIDN